MKNSGPNMVIEGRDDFLSLLTMLHPNALVAWDRDIAAEVEIRSIPPVQVHDWEDCPNWSESVNFVTNGQHIARRDGIGAVLQPKNFRAVLHWQYGDPLKVRWWLDKTYGK